LLLVLDRRDCLDAGRVAPLALVLRRGGSPDDGEAAQKPSEDIRSHQTSSEAIRSQQKPAEASRSLSGGGSH